MIGRRPSRRDLRLGTGLVLFAYVALHLLNHALGLVSLSLAERGLAIAIAVWQSIPGTLLLYGCAAVHISLALESIYARRTLRMAPLDAVRVVLGLGIPTLLIGHAVATRLAWQLYAEPPTYANVVWSLWAVNGQGLQLALLVPGWLHGCIGLHLAFGRRAFYQRLHRLFFAIALLLPVLGAVGFISMGKELAAELAERARLDAGIVSMSQHDAVLSGVARTALAVYFAAIAAGFLAREIRAFVERRSRVLVKVEYPQRTVHVPRGWSVLEASRSHQIPHLSMCGGRARCSTCRVRVTRGQAHCPPPGPEELATLTRIHAGPQVRLACQLRPNGDVAVTPLLAAAPRKLLSAGTHSAATLEQELVGLGVVWRNREAIRRHLLPQDAVFLAMRFGETMATALQAAGGVECDPVAGSNIGVFGIGVTLPEGCRGAWAAAQRIDAELAALATRSRSDFGVSLEFGFSLHVATAAVGEMTGTGRHAAAGPLVDAISELGDAAAASGTPIALSAALYRQGGLELPAHGDTQLQTKDGTPWWPLATFAG